MRPDGRPRRVGSISCHQRISSRVVGVSCSRLFLAFTSFGAFWISYALILIPGTGVIEAYGTDADEFGNAIGIYLITWFIITFLFL